MTTFTVCPVCQLAIHSHAGIEIQASIGTFTSGHSHVICECGWWTQTDTVGAAHLAVAGHEAAHMAAREPGYVVPPADPLLAKPEKHR
jgi:hypothetical protein